MIILLFNYFTNQKLNNNEPTYIAESNENMVKSFEGTVTYIDPRNFPGDEISYYLADSDGKEIVLLRSKDQKLSVVEGLRVRVSGVVEDIEGSTNVLNVEGVTIKNGAN